MKYNMSYMRDQHLLVTASIYYARAATCKMLSLLTGLHIDVSLHTSSHTYTTSLRIRTDRPATPPGTVSENTVPVKVTYYISIS